MPTISLLMPAALLLCQTTLPAGFIETFDDHAADRWRAVVGRWTFAPGAARQSDGAFDCLAVAAEAAASPEGAFYLAVRFKPDSSFNGGGLVFALPQHDRKDGGMLVRCDPGGRILWGRFDAWGEFEYAGDVRITDPGTAEQELAVAVDPDNLAFNVYHNGTRVATNVATNVAAASWGCNPAGDRTRSSGASCARPRWRSWTAFIREATTAASSTSWATAGGWSRCGPGPSSW